MSRVIVGVTNNIKEAGSELKRGLDMIVDSAREEEVDDDFTVVDKERTEPPRPKSPIVVAVVDPSADRDVFASRQKTEERPQSPPPPTTPPPASDSPEPVDDDPPASPTNIEEVAVSILVSPSEMKNDATAAPTSRENKDGETIDVITAANEAKRTADDSLLESRRRQDEIDAEMAMSRRQLDLQIASMRTPPSRKTTYGPIAARSSVNSVRERYEGRRVCNVALLGNSGVGKTTLARRFCQVAMDGDVDGVIVADPEPTVGLDFSKREIRLPNANEIVDVQLWDTSGSERFRSIVASYFRGKDAFVLAYAIDDRGSFDDLIQWANMARSGSPHALVFLVGNKEDARDDEHATITARDASAMATLVRATRAFVTSAKENRGNNVAKTFATIAECIFKEDKGGEVVAPVQRRQPREEERSLLVVKDGDGNYVQASPSQCRTRDDERAASAKVEKGTPAATSRRHWC